jgi:hypothetical protein
MKRSFVAFVLLAFIMCIPVTFASTTTNWDISVSNGSLFCDSTSKSSIQGENVPYASSSYRMSLYALDIDAHLIHNISTENVDIAAKTVLSAGSSNHNSILFQEGVGMHFYGCEEENTTVCFSGYSDLTSSVNQIDFVSSAIVDEASNLEHSIGAAGSGDFGLSTSSYKLSGTVKESFTVESTRSQINIFDAEFTIISYFQDPIDLLPLYESEPSYSLCPFSKP